ncbi:MAG: ATP-binding protein [Thermoplasmata archaeon]|nr:ATP-binding protein [Thermoplasmata archaeon]
MSIASGKGGTGKTLVATNLFAVARDAMLFDCDVEEPNCYIFMGDSEHTLSSKKISRPVPRIDEDKCILCGSCAEACEFHAIASLKDRIMVFEELCHGCGACILFCPARAVTEVDHYVGDIIHVDAGEKRLIYGKLRVSEASPSYLIRKVKGEICEDPGLKIIDCPPGVSCSAVESIRETDYCILVTEPTPFGLHDLRLAAAVVKKIGVPHGVFLNKFYEGSPTDAIEFCNENGIELLGSLPLSRGIAERYARGELIAKSEEFSGIFESLLSKIVEAGGEKA